MAKTWIASDRKYEKVLYPFIGGGEVNKDPMQSPATWAINFFDWPEEEARKYSFAYSKVVQEVKSERRKKKSNGEFKLRNPLPQRWWQYGEKRPALYHAIGRGESYFSHPERWSPDPFSRVLVISTGVTKYPAFSFLPSDYIFSNKLCVIADERYSMLAILSSDIHATWAWAQKTSLGGDLHSLVYAHGNVFETFPFPKGFLQSGHEELERKGWEFSECRHAYMMKRSMGLTKFYNCLHDPREKDNDINQVRSLQADINTLTASQYDLSDLPLETGFHEVGYLPAGYNIRYSISEHARIEVLKKLSRLNRDRHEAQVKLSTTARRKTLEASNVIQSDDLFSAQGGGQ